MDDSSDDELEMPVLQAEIPFPTKPVQTNQSSPLQSINPGPKSKQPHSKPINQTNSSKPTKQVSTPKTETSFSTKSSFPQTSKPVNTKNPSPKRNLTKQVSIFCLGFSYEKLDSDLQTVYYILYFKKCKMF